MTRETKLTDKDMSVLREGGSTRETHDVKRGTLRDYGMQHVVEVRWDLNPEAMREQMFIMKIDDYEVILDAEELMRYIRWV